MSSSTLLKCRRKIGPLVTARPSTSHLQNRSLARGELNGCVEICIRRYGQYKALSDGEEFRMKKVLITYGVCALVFTRSEEHTSELQSPYVISYAVFSLQQTSELQSPYVISYAVFCLKKKSAHSCN